MTTPRRGFLKSLALTPLLPGALVEPPAASAAGEARPGLVEEALADVVRHRYGSHLEPGDLDEIRKGIADNLDNAERLRTVKLGNADEPVTLFHARPPQAEERR